MLGFAAHQGIAGAQRFGLGGDLGFGDVHHGKQVFDLVKIQPVSGLGSGGFQVAQPFGALVNRLNLGTVAAIVFGLLGQHALKLRIRQPVRLLDVKAAGEEFERVAREGVEVVQLLRRWRLRLALELVDLFRADTQNIGDFLDGGGVRVGDLAIFQLGNIAFAVIPRAVIVSKNTLG